LVNGETTSARLDQAEGTHPERLRVAALRGASRWRAFKSDAAMTLRQEQVADIAIRSYTILWSSLAGAER
jgi:hypothetical protein